MLIYLFIVPTILCVVPLLAHTRGTLAIIALIGVAFLGYAWWRVWGALSAPAADPGFGGAVAFMSMILASLAFASGLFGRTLGLALQAQGRTRRDVLWTDVVAIAIPAVFLLVLQFL